jgi:PhnB protein
VAVQPIPEGYRGLIPYLAVDNAAEAIEFYKRAFGATERMRMPGPEGKIAHAELEIAGSILMLADPFPQASTKTPRELGGVTGGIFIYVENADETVQRAVDAGATITMPLEDQFWGDRFGKITDPYGQEWQIATHIEDLTEEEMARRGQEAMAALG